MLTRLPNGKLAVDSLDTTDGRFVEPMQKASDWNLEEYEPNASLMKQKREEKLALNKKLMLDKMKRERNAALAKKQLVENSMNEALQRQEQMQGPSPSQKALAKYHLKNQAMGDQTSDFGPRYDMTLPERHEVYNVTPATGEHYGDKEYFIQEYNYQTNPNYQTLKRRFADNVKWKNPIGMKNQDFVTDYVEGSEFIDIDPRMKEQAEAVRAASAASEFNYSDEDMVMDSVDNTMTAVARAATTPVVEEKKDSKIATVSIIAVLLYSLFG